MESIALALFVCLVLALISKYLSVPAIPFYILAGVLLGKTGLGMLESDPISTFFSEMGLIFLLFFVGLSLKPERIVSNQNAVLISGLIDLNINMIIGFAAAFTLGFTFVESLIVASAFYISSTAMALTSLIENRKLMLKEADTIVWLMVFEDFVLIIILALVSTGDQNLIVFIVKILAALGTLYALAHYGKEFLVSILDRDDELPIIFTFTAVLTTAAVSLLLEIPETMMVIALGVAFATTDADAFEQHARPFKEVFLVVFFVFFGATVDFSGGANWMMIAIICVLAILSKLLSGILTGLIIHDSAMSGLEIWVNTIARGEFSIALAALYGTPLVGTTIAVMVIVTSIVGSFAAKYSKGLRRGLVSSGRRTGPSRRIHHTGDRKEDNFL
jgi:CPA2 family monovalent cation:H+ antiporter-2